MGLPPTHGPQSTDPTASPALTPDGLVQRQTGQADEVDYEPGAQVAPPETFA